MAELVTLQRVKDHIAILKLCREEKANAMSQALLEQLNDKILIIKQDPSFYCAIIHGEGVKAFCAGADLKERKRMSDKEVIRAVQYIGNTVDSIEKLEIPVIAAINGAAFGGGLELALACDMRIASRTAMLGLTETSLAIIPGAGGTQRLPRLIGAGQAKRLIYTAQPITAEEAYAIGLVEVLVEQEHLVERALSVAEKIAGNGPLALRQAKLAINKGSDMNLAAGLLVEHQAYKETISTKDRTEGLLAFSEKRKPTYKGM
ncbi:enoyl-CoA hydratase [Oceanobacillus piezotolerans]|uniref:Enoyl-CoA hydratase n=1 Tax=Oceanobacillus piezotolerans TaxID=2448030 RepID=A0A498D9W9_9BACI|nr:enoyl-CoA hydratase-related protein [Oceanobacillus piezotolerans]RLL45431.1 enoyl-CoA hydratase [Oceanobacillus piezotolerans]